MANVRKPTPQIQGWSRVCHFFYDDNLNFIDKKHPQASAPQDRLRSEDENPRTDQKQGNAALREKAGQCTGV